MCTHIEYRGYNQYVKNMVITNISDSQKFKDDVLIWILKSFPCRRFSICSASFIFRIQCIGITKVFLRLLFCISNHEVEYYLCFLGSSPKGNQEGQKNIIIRHVGAYPKCDIYPLKKTGDDWNIQTLCKDPFWATHLNRKVPTYRIFLDTFTQTKNPPNSKK